MTEKDTLELVRKKADRIGRSRGARPGWRYLVHVGVLGWMFVLAVLLFTYLGHLAAREIGQLWPAVTGVGAGVAVGVYLAWRQIRRDLDGS